MFFQPTYKRRENLSDEFTFLSVVCEDGVELEGVVYESDTPKATLLFFAGRNHDVVGLMPRLANAYKDLRVVAFNYRSYGKSGGKVSEKKLFLDALLVTQKIKKHYGDIYLEGFSLGASIASYVAAQEEVKAVFLLSPFDTLAELTRESHGRFLSLFLRYKYDNISFVQNIDNDVYIYATKADEVIYVKNTRALVPHVKNLALYTEYDNLTHAQLLWHSQMLQHIQGVISNG